MSAPPLLLDFAAPRVRTTFSGVALLIVGIAALTAAGLEYRAATLKKAGLEVKLAAELQSSSHEPLNRARVTRLNEEAAGVARELGAPWTAMLSDLEVASQDTKEQIAVLSVEPDHDKHRIRISGESKDLKAALAYLERLKTSKSLRYPMLDSHEIVADNNEHPVKFAMTADWRETP